MSDNAATVCTIEQDPATYLAVLKRAYSKHYLEESDVWTNDPQMRSFPALVQGSVKLTSSARVIDVGCGAGRDVEYFAGLCDSVTGLDIYRHDYWETVAQQHANASFYCTDLLSYSADAKYDLVIDNGCFHHQHPDQLSAYLAKVVSILKKDGCFALSTFKNPAIDEFVDVNGRLHKYFGDAELQKILSTAGFSVFREFDIYRANKKDYYRLSFCRLV